MASRLRFESWPKIAIPLLAVAVLAAACTGQTVDETTSSTENQRGGDAPTPPPPAHIAPVLRQAGQPGEVLVGVGSTLGALVLSENPITKLELWDGAELINSVEVTEPEVDVRTAFDWIPDTPGLHGLTLRAMDEVSGVATSFPLWIRARQPADTEAGLTPNPTTMETSELLSEISFSTTGSENISGGVSSILNALDFPNPGAIQFSINPDTCVATLELPTVQNALGTAVYAAPIGSVGYFPMDLVSPQGGTMEIPVGSAPAMVYAESYDAVSTNPGPPTIITPPAPCVEKGWSGDLQFTDGILSNPKLADRAYLYVSTDGGEVWDRAPGEDQTFVYPDPDGAFDFSGLLPPSTQSDGIIFEAWGWVDETLMPLGRGGWNPPEAATGAPNFGDLVTGNYGGPLLAPSDLDWVVQDDPTTLIRSGMLCTYPIPPAPAPTTTTVPVSVIGGTVVTTPTTSPSFAIGQLPESCSNAPLGAYSKTFRWKPIPGAYETGLVQVSTKPIPSGPVANFPGLTHVQNVAKPPSGHVDFEIPIDKILNPPADTTVLPDYESLTYASIASLVGESGGQQGNQIVALLLPKTVSGGGNTTLYIRVTPKKDGKLLVGESNDVVIAIDDTPPPGKIKIPPKPAGISVQVTMTPPTMPNPDYLRCVRVVENPFGSKNPPPSTTKFMFEWNGEPVPSDLGTENQYKTLADQAFIYENGARVTRGLVPGSTACAWKVKPPSKSWWEYIVDAVNFVGWVWDLYVTVWDGIKGFVADVIAVVSGCTTLAEASGESAADAKKFCSGIANSAINYALIAYGVPPTMPKFSEFAALGKGELKAFVLKTIVDEGGLDCSVLQSECEKMIDKMLDELINEMELAASKAAVQTATNGSQWVMAVHPLIKVIPEPAGAPPTARFEVKITRSADPNAAPPPAVCPYTATVFGDKAKYEWQNYKKNEWQTGPVSGQVMVSNSTSVDLSKLKPGESTGAMIVLDKFADWYPPGQNPAYDPVPWNFTGSKTWIFLVDYGVDAATYPLTTLTMVLSGGTNCGGASSSFVQDHVSTEPWEIPFP